MGHERRLGYIEVLLPFKVGIMIITHFCDIFFIGVPIRENTVVGELCRLLGVLIIKP